MKVLEPNQFDENEIVAELLDGSGAVLLKNVFDKAMIAEAHELLVRETDKDVDTGSHFNQSGADARLQRRVWFTEMMALSPIFAEMLEHPFIQKSMRAFLGTEFVLGGFCASRIMPGFGGQEPHIDYPYWDFYRSQTFPTRTNSSFPLNAQAVILIDPFTEENGATALAPGSQKSLRYPGEGDGFYDKCVRLTGNPGDVVLFYGAAWHCAMPNKSDAGRIGILVEFLPKFVKPIEDMWTDLDPDFRKNASPIIRQLLGFDYPWPSTPPHPPIAVT
ncbi:MAG: phytanoyl-CoA dioxygenase family protein [Hyphomicrobiales bacterium]|nr:phytanoyl-CoA dioxygenase family protein [Hyphomicrobiales bacterium]